MNPGALREKLIFKTLSRTSDGAGGTTATTSVAFTTSAAVKQGKSVRTIENGRLTVLSVYEVTIRQSAQHTPAIDMLIEWRGQDYRIEDIPTDTDPYNRYQRLTITRML